MGSPQSAGLAGCQLGAPQPAAPVAGAGRTLQIVFCLVEQGQPLQTDLAAVVKAGGLTWIDEIYKSYSLKELLVFY